MNWKCVNELTKLEELVAQIVTTDVRTEISRKVDILERALEFWRINNKQLENRIPFEQFAMSDLLVDDGRVHTVLPSGVPDLGTGTKPVILQPKLLMFLLLYHRENYEIYQIIDSFVHKIWDELTMLDFKRTKTGVVRCFTNTRFAANTLRDYGFLKFSRNEAYKTWVLSLPGFLVAAQVIKEGNWSLLIPQNTWSTVLHPTIWNTWRSVQSYDCFVECLANICIPDCTVFNTFDAMLHKAYRLLDAYWKTLSDRSLTVTDRQRRSSDLMKELETFREIEAFYEEFVASIRINELIASVK